MGVDAKKEDFGPIHYILAIMLFFGLSIITFEMVKGIDSFGYDTYDPKSDVLNSTEVLNLGKNIVVFDNYVSVKELVGKNSFVEAVSYYDSYNEQTVGYLNVFGGIGKDFLIIPGQEYEIFVKESLSLKL